MKKTLLLTNFLLLVIFASAQILPNHGFETWELFTGYENPVSWDTPNIFTTLVGVVVVSKSVEAHSGDYSALLETKTVLGENKSPGLLTLADFRVDLLTGDVSFVGGIDLADKVNSMGGWYKYSGAAGDSASVFIVSFRHPEGQEIDTTGVGIAYLHDAGDWTNFTVNMNQMNENQPDSFNVIIRSSASDELNVGSKLFVDDLTLETVTGIINLSKESTTIKVYPNPVSEDIVFEMESAGNNSQLSIFDNSGREVEQKTFSGKSTKINVSSFSAGVYSYRITRNNKLFGSGNFIKE